MDLFSTSPLLVWAELFEVTVASPVVIDRQEHVTSVKALPDSTQSIWRSCYLVGFPQDTDVKFSHVKFASVYSPEVSTS